MDTFYNACRQAFLAVPLLLMTLATANGAGPYGLPEQGNYTLDRRHYYFEMRKGGEEYAVWSVDTPKGRPKRKEKPDIRSILVFKLQYWHRDQNGKVTPKGHQMASRTLNVGSYVTDNGVTLIYEKTDDGQFRVRSEGAAGGPNRMATGTIISEQRLRRHLMEAEETECGTYVLGPRVMRPQKGSEYVP